jgi:hypothetical protein
MMKKEDMMAAMEDADKISKTLYEASNAFYSINDGGVSNQNREVLRLKDIGLRLAADAARVAKAIVAAYDEAMNPRA